MTRKPSLKLCRKAIPKGKMLLMSLLAISNPNIPEFARNRAAEYLKSQGIDPKTAKARPDNDTTTTAPTEEPAP